MRLIDADKLKEEYKKLQKTTIEFEIAPKGISNLIDNTPTVAFPFEICGNTCQVVRPQGECKSCRHRDPEDKKCDCGGQERQGCSFPVSDDYYCKYYERGKEE